MIKVSYFQEFLDAYYEDIAHRRFKNETNKSLKDIYDERFIKIIGVDLKTLLCGSFEELPMLDLSSEQKEELKKVFNYQDKFQVHISELFKKYLDIHTCYYCNIDFINVFKGKNKNILTGYTLDHILDKASYPYLALSVSNLIPTCYICNSKLKKDRSIGNRVPTSKDFDFDKRVKFKTFIKSNNLQINSKDSFELLLKEDFSDIYDKYMDVLELDGRYEYHKYKVLELIEKRKNYPDSRIKELAKIAQKTEEEVKQDIFGEYLLDEEDLHKRPLSKLIKDIANELGLD